MKFRLKEIITVKKGEATTSMLIWAFGFVFMVAVMVTIVDYFTPLAAKNDMNTYCRSALLSMENSGGLNNTIKNTLIDKMTARGFKNVSVTGTGTAALGKPIDLTVEADYKYSQLQILVTVIATQHMVYNHTSAERMVVN